eukprot:scaffold23.g4105.t1
MKELIQVEHAAGYEPDCARSYGWKEAVLRAMIAKHPHLGHGQRPLVSDIANKKSILWPDGCPHEQEAKAAKVQKAAAAATAAHAEAAAGEGIPPHDAEWR